MVLKKLQQGLLNALAGDVPGNGSVLALAGDFIDLIDINNPTLRALHVKVRRLKQLQDNVLHILAHISRLGKGGGVGDGEGHIQHFRHGLGKKGLAAAGRADKQNIALLELNIILVAMEDALVVVIHRHGQDDLRPVLADYIFVEPGFYLHGLGQLFKNQGEPVIALHGFCRAVINDTHAHSHAFVAYIAAVTGYQSVDKGLRLAAKRASDAPSLFIFCHNNLPFGRIKAIGELPFPDANPFFSAC